jgi:hypothetical protein
MWSNKKPSEDGHYWHVIEHYVNGELEKRYGPSLVLVKIEEDDIDGGYDVWIDYIGSDDGDYLKFKDEMIIERVVPRDPIFGWDTKEAAKRKAKDLVKRKWVYWFKPLPEAYFDPENKTIDPYEVTHQEGIVSIENPLPDNRESHGDLGVQIARDGRIWLCFNGSSLIRFKPISKATYDILHAAASKAAVIKEDEI